MSEQRCTHGQITAYPSSNSAFPGFARCAVCDTMFVDSSALQSRIEALEAERDSLQATVDGWRAYDEELVDVQRRAEQAEAELAAVKVELERLKSS